MTISIDQPNGMAPAREPDLAMRVVLIGESPSALAMVRIMRAQRGGAAFDCVGTQTLLDGLVAVDRDAPNCVIVDLELPDSVGLETLDVVLRHVPDVAVVALAGVDDHGAGRMAVSYGADDYLVKGTTDAGLMTRTLHRAIERKQTALTTRHDEARFRALLDVAPDAIMACDVNGLITLWNAGAEVTYGWPASEAIGQNMNELLAPGTDPDVFVRDLLHAGRWLVELQHRTKDGRSIDIEGQWTVLEDDHGRPIGLLGSNHDVTMRRSTQAELEENRAQLADLIDIAPDAIISIDGAQLITLFNQSAETIFGYSVDEVIGLSIEMLLPGKFVARQRSRLAESGRDQANHRRLSPRADIEGRRKDGALFPAEASISKLVRGDRVTYTVILRDVTARRQTDEALRSSEARLTAVLDTLPVGVIVARADGQPVYVNHHAREILGQPIEYGDDYRLVRSRYRVAGTPELYPEDRLPISRALDGEEGVMADLEISIGGRPVPLRVSFAPILDRAGAVEFGIAVLEDVTDERLATTLLAHQAEELARSNAELEQFAYVASHDLSEPLRSVAGFVQLLSQRYKGRLDDDADEFIGFTLEGVRRMQTLIQDLLTYSRVSRLDYERVAVDCNRLVAEALQAETFIHVSELPTVWGDAGQLRSVFQNLVANGLKFKAPGREPEIWISARRRDSGWEFCVADNGIGIAEQHRERVFKMFQRLHSQDDFPGTGMGLSICQRIVQRHGGKIWVENNHDHGSAFRFTLPDRETLP